jgi:hypothetical protein
MTSAALGQQLNPGGRKFMSLHQGPKAPRKQSRLLFFEQVHRESQRQTKFGYQKGVQGPIPKSHGRVL